MSALGWYLILVCSVCAAGSNFLLRVCINHVGDFRFNFDSFSHLATQPLFFVGVFLYSIATVGWFRVIATEPLSLAYPIMISGTFFLITIGAVILFHENLNLYNILGLGLIVVGIFFVGR